MIGSLEHAYVRAFQQRCCFFAVTSVTLGGKLDVKKLSVNCAAKHLFDTFALSSGVVNFVICQNMSEDMGNVLKYSDLRECCDTCDSKNDKTPVDARTRTRERG